MRRSAPSIAATERNESAPLPPIECLRELAAILANARLLNNAAIAHVRHELNAIDARRAGGGQ